MRSALVVVAVVAFVVAATDADAKDPVLTKRPRVLGFVEAALPEGQDPGQVVLAIDIGDVSGSTFFEGGLVAEDEVRDRRASGG